MQQKFDMQQKVVEFRCRDARTAATSAWEWLHGLTNRNVVAVHMSQKPVGPRNGTETKISAIIEPGKPDKSNLNELLLPLRDLIPEKFEK